MTDELETVDLSRYVSDNLADTLGTVIESYLRFLDYLSKAIWYSCYIIGSAMVLLITAQVTTRYALGFVPVWGPELSRYMMIWIAMSLAGVLVYEDDHLQVELLSQKLSIARRRQLRTLQLTVLLGFSVLLLWAGNTYAQSSGTIQQSPSMPFQMFWPYTIITVTAGLLILFTLGKLVQINYYPNMVVQDYESKYVVEDEDTVR